MLSRKLIPTPLAPAEPQAPIEVAPLRPLRRLETLRVAFRLIGFGLWCLWATRIRRMPAAEFAPRVRSFLEERGGLWIKAGQIFSLRTDLLSREMADELASLQGRVIGFPPEDSRRIIEESLGRPIESLFDRFEEHPFAAASIAQVHRAHLRGENASVVIKVQRPDIGAIFARDLKVIAAALWFAKRMPSLSYITWDGMLQEIRRIMEEETDYRYEAENLRRMRKVLRPHRVYVPKIFRAYATAHVLVMEHIPGTLMSDYLRVFRADPARAAAWRDENNVDDKRVGSRLLRSLYRQMFEDNLFHGDLHPGNIMLLRNSRFALIDLGAIGSLERRFLQLYQQQTQAWAVKDYSKSFDYYLLLADSIPIFDVAEFKADAVAIVRAWEARTHLRGLSYYEKSVTGGVGGDLAQLARKYQVNLSWQFLRVSRALGTMDASLVALLGNSNPNKIMRKYFEELRRRSIRRALTGGVLRMGGDVLSEIRQITASTADTMRQQAIRFEGVRSTASYVIGAVLGGIRLALILGGFILLYDLLEAHYHGVIAPVHERIGAFRGIADLLPDGLPFELSVAGLIGVLVFLITAGRAKKKLRQKTIRLPNGKLDR